MTHKKRKKVRNFIFSIAGCFLLRFEGFFCSIGVLYRGLGISKLKFLKEKKISVVNLFQFFVIKTLAPVGSGSITLVIVRATETQNTK